MEKEKNLDIDLSFVKIEQPVSISNYNFIPYTNSFSQMEINMLLLQCQQQS